MASYDETFKAAKAANPGLSDAEITEGLAANGVTRPSEPGLMEKYVNQPVQKYVGQPLQAAREAVQPLADAAAGALRTPALRSDDPGTEAVARGGLANALNPVPGDAGSGAATVASLIAAIATGGKAGFLPALARTAAPPIASALGQYAQNGSVNPMDTFLTVLGSGTPEIAAGALGAYRKIRGAQRLQPDDLGRVSGAVSIPGRTVAPTAEDLALAGEAKGQPGSLATVADQRFKNLINTVGRAGDAVTTTIMRPSGVLDQNGRQIMVPTQVPLKIMLPSGDEVLLSEALDEVAGLRSKGAPQGAPTKTGGAARAEARVTYDAIDQQLRQAGQGHLADALLAGRQQLAQDMSKHRLIEQARSRGLIDEKGNLDMSALQQRFDELVDAKKQGKAGITPSVRQPLENAVRRGQPGVGVDQPGEFKMPFLRFGKHGTTAGENVGSILRAKMPTFVGTPENLAALQAPQGMARNLLSVGGLLSADAARRALEGGSNE